jgi:hypothetical protein
VREAVEVRGSFKFQAGIAGSPRPRSAPPAPPPSPPQRTFLALPLEAQARSYNTSFSLSPSGSQRGGDPPLPSPPLPSTHNSLTARLPGNEESAVAGAAKGQGEPRGRHRRGRTRVLGILVLTAHSSNQTGPSSTGLGCFLAHGGVWSWVEEGESGWKAPTPP